MPEKKLKEDFLFLIGEWEKEERSEITFEGFIRWLRKKECSQCGFKYDPDELSTPNDPKLKKVRFCQDCLEGIMNGSIKIDYKSLCKG